MGDRNTRWPMAIHASAQHIFPLLFVKQAGENRDNMDFERPSRKKKGRRLSPSDQLSSRVKARLVVTFGTELRAEKRTFLFQR